MRRHTPYEAAIKLILDSFVEACLSCRSVASGGGRGGPLDRGRWVPEATTPTVAATRTAPDTFPPQRSDPGQRQL